MSAEIPPDSGSLVISGWTAVSAYGLGAAAFTEGVRGGRDALGPEPDETLTGPYTRVGAVPGFDVRQALGTKGTRSMDRLTGLTATAVGLLLDGTGLTADPERIGLVLGTGSGSVRSIMEFTRDSLVGERPYDVDPARFPNTVMNCAAGAAAIRYGLKGVNTTVAGGAPTGLLALNYTRRVHRSGVWNTIICGAVEELSAQRGWLEWHATGGRSDPPGEGCALFLVESAAEAARHGRRPLATVLGAGFRAFPGEADAGPALRRCIEDVLARTGAKPGDVRLAALAETPGALGEAERTGVAAALGVEVPVVGVRAGLGDTGAASAAFQIAAVLASDAGEGIALVTSLDRSGTAGCVLLGLAPRPQ